MSTKKISSIIIAVFLILSVGQIAVSAAQWDYVSKTSDQLGKTFSSKWKDYGTYKVGNNYYDFTFGYDTVLFKEDYVEYVHAQESISYYHYGKVKNGNGITEVTSQAQGTAKTDSAQVRHYGAPVTYYVYSRAISSSSSEG